MQGSKEMQSKDIGTIKKASMKHYEAKTETSVKLTMFLVIGCTMLKMLFFLNVMFVCLSGWGAFTPNTRTSPIKWVLS